MLAFQYIKGGLRGFELEFELGFEFLRSRLWRFRRRNKNRLFKVECIYKLLEPL